MPSSINPANGAVLATFDEADATAIESALARAAETQRAWRRQPPTERARLLARVAVVLRRHQDEWARLISLEMGKLDRAGDTARHQRHIRHHGHDQSGHHHAGHTRHHAGYDTGHHHQSRWHHHAQ